MDTHIYDICDYFLASLHGGSYCDRGPELCLAIPGNGGFSSTGVETHGMFRIIKLFCQIPGGSSFTYSGRNVFVPCSVEKCSPPSKRVGTGDKTQFCQHSSLTPEVNRLLTGCPNDC